MVSKKNKNLNAVKAYKKKLQGEIDVAKVIFFGSRTRNDYHDNSDFDLVIVSDDFHGAPWYKRAANLYLMWEEDDPLELLCYTPEELDRKKNQPGIISEAVNKGVEV